jgi:simple sugar transport system ATP-binding protein
MSASPLLELRKVSQAFGPISVLQDIDFEIRPGEVVALLGDNGAGKSTLIKVIAGYHRPTSGTLAWEGRAFEYSATDGPHEAREMGVETVYQHLGLVPTLSIARNFFLGREPRGRFGLDHRKMLDTARTQLAEMGIRRKLDPRDSVARLSGGERQAIAIARARHFNAKLMILDEPTSALSLRQTEQVLQYIRDAAKSGIAVIFITHTLHHIEDLVDRITVIYHGKKVGDYLPKDVTRAQVSSLITRGVLA